MRVVIFDLDFTLASTGPLQTYLTSQVGREKVVSDLRSGLLNVTNYGQELVNIFNRLGQATDCCATIVSDSPREYCLEVLRLAGYRVDPRLVFGAQSKPLIDYDTFDQTVSTVLGVANGTINYIVIGDSPKDIYFAHSIRAPSIFAKWGSRHPWTLAKFSYPTHTASNIQELTNIINMFLRGEVTFRDYDFSQDYLTLDDYEVEIVELENSELGFGREYLPNHELHRGAHDIYASQDLHWVVKKAKDYNEQHHKQYLNMQIYGRSGPFNVGPLKRKAGHFKREFLNWCDSKKISGKILLIPVPPSVPRECNLTHTMRLICEWWSEWIRSDRTDMDIEVYDIFERYWPRRPSHLTEGRREIHDHFDTLGVFMDDSEYPVSADYVIIVDDVLTSGSHINAIASFIRSANLVEDDARLLGYTLFKTIHPEDHE